MSDRPLRIAMVAACPLPYPRGTPVRAARIAEGLARAGHEVHVVTYHLGRGELDDRVRVHRIREVSTYRRLAPGPSYQKLIVVDPLLYGRLRSLLRSGTFDVLHAHHYEGLIIGALARRGMNIPLIYDAHTLLVSELPYYHLLPHAALQRWVGAVLDRTVPRLADHTIAVTHSIRNHLIDHGRIAPDRITMIGNGVESAHFAPVVSIPGSGSTDGERTLLFAGGLAPYQGIEAMLRVFQQVRSQRPRTRMLIVTENDDGVARYEALARKLGVLSRIDFLRSDFNGLPALLRGADLALNPRPPCDGLPLKLLNYMAAGKPIVTFAGSAPGLVDGETARVVPDDDIHAFARAVLELLADPSQAQHIGTRAREKALREFSWETVTAEVLDTYRTVLRTSTTRARGSRRAATAATEYDSRTGHRQLMEAIDAIRHARLPERGSVTSPRLTVAMPARNSATHIAMAIRSVLLQEGVECEIIVVDDASQDDTPAIVASFSDPRVRYVRNEHRRGIGYCHNRALQLARGELLVHVDADDFILPDALRRAALAMDTAPGAGQVFANVYQVDADACISETEVERQRSWLLTHRGLYDINTTLLLHGMIATPLRTYRTHLIRQLGGFDETLRYAVDFEMTLRLADTHEIAYLPEFLYCQRIWDGNTQATMRLRSLRSWRTRAGLIRRQLRGRRTLLGCSRTRVAALVALGFLHAASMPTLARAAEHIVRPNRTVRLSWRTSEADPTL